MKTGAFKLKDGTVVCPRTQAENVLVTLGEETHSLADILSVLVQDPVEMISASRDADIPANTDYTVPEYVVGCSNISVYLDGLKVSCGTNGGFVEVGTKDTVSTTIQFRNAVPKEVEMVIRVGR